MAEIEIAPLTDRLSDDEISELVGVLEKLGVNLPRSDDSSQSSLLGDVDDEVLQEFLDRLDAHDVSCDVYLPLEFDGCVEIGEMRVGSAVLLLEVLDELKDDLGIVDEDEDESDEEDDDYRAALDGQLRDCWRTFYAACNATLERHLPLHIKA